MAAPGRKPKPTGMKVLAGNPGKRKLPKSEPKPKPVAPGPPAWLDKEAKELWKEFAPELERLGLLTLVDAPSFAMMLTHYIMAVKASRLIKRDGIMTKDENGLARKHPAHQIMRDHATAFRGFAAEFGLTPSARARLSIAEPENDDEAFFGST